MPLPVVTALWCQKCSTQVESDCSPRDLQFCLSLEQKNDCLAKQRLVKVFQAKGFFAKWLVGIANRILRADDATLDRAFENADRNCQWATP